MAMKNPPHPGDFIRTEIIQPAGMSVTAAAAALKVSRPALSSLLNGKADLSGDMALRIEKAFGVKMDTLMRMQSSYDIAQTRLREGQIRVRRILNTSEPYKGAHRQATALLDKGFQLGGKIRASRDEWHDR
jgi:antitoxin HigA-1